MSADVLPFRLPPVLPPVVEPMGNGAREALIDLFTDTMHAEPWKAADILLMELWLRGFVVVPMPFPPGAA